MKLFCLAPISFLSINFTFEIVLWDIENFFFENKSIYMILTNIFEFEIQKSLICLNITYNYISILMCDISLDLFNMHSCKYSSTYNELELDSLLKTKQKISRINFFESAPICKIEIEKI
jgi:hypothetical protein